MPVFSNERWFALEFFVSSKISLKGPVPFLFDVFQMSFEMGLFIYFQLNAGMFDQKAYAK